MLVDGADDGAEDRQEDGVLVGRLAGVEEIALAVGDRPVVVLAGAVDAGKGLLVEEADEPMSLGDGAQDLHREHVVVNGQILLLEDGGDLELGGRRLVVARLGGDAQTPQLLLHLRHERRHARTYRAKVVVLELLVLGRRRPEQRPPRLHQVGTLHIEPPVNEEVLLLGPHGDGRVRLRQAKRAHQARDGAAQRLDGAQNRRLLVEDLAGVGAEDRGDAERGAVRVTLDERGAGRVPGGVAARLERAAQTARRKARGVALAHHQVLSGELEDGLAVLMKLQECVVLLGGAARHRLEPVRVVRRAALQRPLLHAVRHVVRDVRVEWRLARQRRQQLLSRVLRQMLADGRLPEYILAVVADAHF